MLAAVVVAVATSVLSLLVALLTQRQQARFAAAQSARDARQDYEYEARKRLYQQCEPVLFLARELAEMARARIEGLARTCRSNDLRPDGTGWLSDHEYYFRSCSYYLFAPVTAFQVLRARLTSVDLNLDPALRLQYEILKLIFFSFTTDFRLASYEPALAYDPDKADPGVAGREERLARAPAEYRRQGLYLGTLEELSEALGEDQKGDSPQPPILKTFARFSSAFDNPKSDLHRHIPDLDDLLAGFHPETCPVLWRVIISQYFLYGVFLQAGASANQNDSSNLLRSVIAGVDGGDALSVLAYGTRGGAPTEEEARASFDAARRFVVDQLELLATRLSPRFHTEH